MSRRIVLLVAVALAALGSGCVESFARRSTRGALGAAETKLRESDQPRALAKGVARGATAGAVKEVTEEERRAALSQLSKEVANAAAAGLQKEMTQALGPNGEGPLGVAMTNTAERVAQSAIFPECTGPGRPACIRAQSEKLAEASAAGFARALRQQLGLGLLLSAFAAGGLCTLAVLSLWSALRGKRRALRTSTGPVTT